MTKLMTVFIFLTLIQTSACSFLKREGSWGKRSLYPLKGERIITSLKNNLSSPHFWAPLTGASFIYLTGLDGTISEFATHARVVSSHKDSADSLSDTLNQVLEIERYASIMLTTSWESHEGWGEYGLSKIRGGVVSELSARSARAGNNQLRKSIFRRRPDHSDHRSLPSGHATEASASRAVISRNLDSSGLENSTVKMMNIINGVMTGGVMWSRVEAKRHFASDALSGYSIGYFMSAFLYDSLINIESDKVVGISILGDKYSMVFVSQF